MSGPLGLSIGTTNLVAARVGNQPVSRRSVLTLSTDRTPQVGVPESGPGVTLGGFVERVGDPVPLVAPDGASYPADTLLVEALDAMVELVGGPSDQLAIAVPAHWGAPTLRALRNALRHNPSLSRDGRPARLIPDAVASLAALRANPGLPSNGVVALLDFGGLRLRQYGTLGVRYQEAEAEILRCHREGEGSQQEGSEQNRGSSPHGIRIAARRWPVTGKMPERPCFARNSGTARFAKRSQTRLRAWYGAVRSGETAPQRECRNVRYAIRIEQVTMRGNGCVPSG